MLLSQILNDTLFKHTSYKKTELDSRVFDHTKIVCVRNKSNRKDWLAFLCTNPDLSEEKIIGIYGKHWQVELFIKTCKSTLNLIDQCRSLSYDALTAHIAIVFTRYILLALEQRKNDNQR